MAMVEQVSMMASLEDHNLMHTMFSYCHAIDLMNCSCSCRSLRHHADDESLWKALCDLADVRQASNRARGIRLWKELYISNLCNECNIDAINGEGIVKIDVEGGRFKNKISNSVISLCIKCFNSVQSIPMKDRKALSSCKLLPNLRKKLCYEGRDIMFFQIIQKIPESKRKSKAEKAFDKYHIYENPNHNNSLLRLIKKKKVESL